LPLHQFDVETQRLQLANKHVERFRHAWLDAWLALDDGLVNLRAAINVVDLPSTAPAGCARHHSFQCPHFHFAEALSAELRLPPSGCWVMSEYGPMERA